MKVISTKKAPAAIGPYSQAIQVGNLVYTSGQIPIDPSTGAFVEGGNKGADPSVFDQCESNLGGSWPFHEQCCEDNGIHGRHE